MKSPTTTIFNKVQYSIFKLVEIGFLACLLFCSQYQDSFPRFAKSDEYHKAVEDLKKKKARGSGIFKKKESQPELAKRIKKNSRERSSTISILEDFFKNRPSQEQIVATYSNISGTH